MRGFSSARGAYRAANAEAQFNLGYAYEYGLGVLKDLQQAIAWYEKAAAQGDVLAQEVLDELQAEGD